MKLDIVGPNPEPFGKLAPQPWMTAAETLAVWEALTADGTEVRFIGGCVRDALLKRPIRDIDIATPDPPEKVMALLGRAGIHVIPTGIAHGTVTAVVGGTPFEITTLRVDLETDGRRAKVAFTDDWIADASRRDFTINAFSCNRDGDVYDPFNGLDDLARGHVRFVGNPRDRIREDVLRLLRFFRFYATYGRPPADPDALAACRLEAHKLPILSGERVRVEIFRILMSPNPADVALLMRGEGVLEHVLPEAGDVGRLRLMSWLDTRAIRFESVHPHPIRRLAALLDTDRAGAEAVADRLRLSNEQRHRLVATVETRWPVDADSDDKVLRRALYRQGAETVRDRLLLAWAAER
ncbi:MAG: CCA tRNA nucleotidyltransferase, partial [Magnetospirillum sp. WYHS-4]